MKRLVKLIVRSGEQKKGCGLKGIKHRDTEIVGHEDGIPIVICDTHPYNRKLYVVSPGETQWRFYCQYCRRYHYHGNVPGHRVAHLLFHHRIQHLRQVNFSH